MNAQLTRTKSLSVLLIVVMLFSSVAKSQDKEGASDHADRLTDIEVTLDPSGALEERLAEMSPTDLKDYLLKKQELQLKSERSPFESSDSLPKFAILMVFGMPIAIIGLIVFFKYKRRKLLHETVRAMVEKGVDIPSHLFEEESTKPQSAFRRGVVLVGVGLGLCSFFLVSGGEQGIGIGLIPLFIGVAYLVIWKLERTNKQNSEQS